MWSLSMPLSSKYFLNNTYNRNDLPHLLIPVIILIIPLSFLIFNCSRYESLLISIIWLLVFVHCTIFGNVILPLNYFYLNSHYYFLCICTFLCSNYRRYAKRIPTPCTITRCKYPFFLIATTQIDKLSEINQSFLHIYNLT